MDKKIEYLKKYVDYLERGGMSSTRDELEAKYYVENDSELAAVVKNIKEASNRDTRLKIIEDYKNQELNKKDELEKIKEACSKVFGISLENIEYKKLKSGIDIIAFHDPNLNRKRIIDYSYAKSLVTEFTKSGLGLGFITKEYLNNELENNELFEVKLDKKIPSRKLGIAYLSNKPLSKSSEKFIDLLKNKI